MERSPRITGEAVQSPAGAQHGPEELEASPLGSPGWLFNKTALLAGSMKGLGSTLPLFPPPSVGLKQFGGTEAHPKAALSLQEGSKAHGERMG